MTSETVPWMLSDAAGAYFGKISFCAPLFPYRRGLSWQNLFLRPALPISPGLILAKFLSAPRSSHIAGAYFDEISCYAPLYESQRVYRLGFSSHASSTKASGYIGLILSHIPSSTKTSGYNRLGFASHTLVHVDQRV